MLAPMAVLCACCAVIGLGPALVAPVLDGALGAFSGSLQVPRLAEAAPLSALSIVGAAVVAAVAAGMLWARRGRKAETTVTWDCGYAAPTTRMQYTSSSFADMVVGLFAVFHGYAHAIEAPAAGTGGYILGFVAATILLHVIGLGLGWGARRTVGDLGLRALGGAVMAGGALVLIAN